MPDTVTVMVRLKCFLRKEEEQGIWISGCRRLDLYSQGDSQEEAKANLYEAMKLWFESCIQRDTLDHALREVGMHPVPWGTTAAEDDAESVHVITHAGEEDDDRALGESFQLAVEIPAWQAAIFSSSENSAAC